MNASDVSPQFTRAGETRGERTDLQRLSATGRTAEGQKFDDISVTESESRL